MDKELQLVVGWNQRERENLGDDDGWLTKFAIFGLKIFLNNYVYKELDSTQCLVDGRFQFRLRPDSINTYKYTGLKIIFYLSGMK